MSESSNVLEVKRLLQLIDPYKLSKKDFEYVKRTKSKIEDGADVTDNVVYWLRDVKDRQLEQV
jgi:hypothetical protein